MLKTNNHNIYLRLVGHTLAGLILLITTCLSNAQPDAQPIETSKTVNGYDIHYSLFESHFLTPEIASQYGLKRGKQYAILNIAVTKASSTGLATDIQGTYTNLLQQQKTLRFKPIKEGKAHYYLAVVRFDKNDTLHFNLTLLPSASESASTTQTPITLKFTRTLRF